MTAFFKNRRRGSVTIMAVMILLVLGGLMAAASPMIINEVKMNTVNRDMIEAQYAAEAGAKVGIAAIYGNKEEWSWLGNTFSLTSGSTNKTYSVTITPALTGAPEAGKEYTITSTGTVNGSIKKVSVKVKAGGSGMPAALSSIVFGNANIIMNNSAKIYGSAGTNGYISMTSNSNEITGVATYNTNVQKSSSGTYNYPITSVGSENGVTTTLAVPTFTVTYTTPTAPAVVSATDWPYGTWAVNNTALPLASGYYSSKGQLDSGASTIVIQPNTTIYVTKNDLSLYQSTWTMGNNAVIYIMKGDLKLNTATTLTMPGSSTVYIGNGNSTVLYGQWGNANTTLTLGTLGKASLFYCNGNANIGYTKFNINGPTSGTDTTKVYFTGDLDLNGGAIMNIAGNVEIYISGTMKLSNDVKIAIADNSKVTFKVGGYSEMNSNATITTGNNNSALALLIDAEAHFTNNTVINKAVVIATGNIAMDSNASITGAVVSTGTTITMSNNSQITTDPDTVALVWDNILNETSSGGSGGSSGSSSFEIISWQK